MLVTAGVLVPAAAASAAPGGVFITGHDPDFHAVSGNTTGAQNIIKRGIGYVTNDAAAPTVLLVNGNMAPPPGHIDSQAGLTASGYPVTEAAAAGNGGAVPLESVDFDDYDVVVVGSDFGGTLRQAELDILNARTQDVIDFVNDGGGLVALAESNGGAHLTPGGGQFDFLPFLADSTQLDQNEANYTVTPFGQTEVGLTNADVNNNFSHNVFLNTGGMEIVDRDGSGRIMSLAVRGKKVCQGGVPTLSIGDVSQNEGNAGFTDMVFTVAVDISPCGANATVDFQTSNDTADNTDYTPTSGQLTFTDGGPLSQTIKVPIAGDVVFEPDELFKVTLSNGNGVAIGDGEATGTIVNDDPNNKPPDCSKVTASPNELWPPNHKFHQITLGGATDPDGDAVTLTVTGVTQDEPVNGLGDGDTSPDAADKSANKVKVRAERSGNGDGRVYRIAFTGTDGKDNGTCTGVATVSVPHDQGPKGAAVDSGGAYNSFG